MVDRFLFIVNPRASRWAGRGRWTALLAEAQARGLAVETAETAGIGHAVELARRAAGQYAAVVAVGGDGTVNETASGLLLADSDTPLGIIPFGTGNDMAHIVGCDTPEAALDALARGATRHSDAISVSRAAGIRYALLYAAVGFAGSCCGAQRRG